MIKSPTITTASEGEPVGAGVQPVRDQRGRSDPPTDPDPVRRDPSVAHEPDELRHDQRADVLDGMRLDQPSH